MSWFSPCQWTRFIISVGQPEGVKHLLLRMGLWEMQKRTPLKIKSPPSRLYVGEQIPSYDYADPDFPFEAPRFNLAVGA